MKKKPTQKKKATGKKKRAEARTFGVFANWPAMACVAAVAFAFVWLFYPTYQIRVAQERQLLSVRRELVSMQKQNEALKERIKQIKSLEYVERYAREKMGLVKPGEKAYVVLPPNRPARAKVATRTAEATSSVEPTGTWNGIRAFFARLFSW